MTNRIPEHTRPAQGELVREIRDNVSLLNTLLAYAWEMGFMVLLKERRTPSRESEHDLIAIEVELYEKVTYVPRTREDDESA